VMNLKMTWWAVLGVEVCWGTRMASGSRDTLKKSDLVMHFMPRCGAYVLRNEPCLEAENHSSPCWKWY
jgi:hypothetical protein